MNDQRTKPESNGPASDREIVLSREFNAPRELVWKAWTDPAHMPQWWGPAGFRTTTHKHELRPGGVWRYVMHGPDGRDYENLMTYIEIVEPERLTYTMGGEVECEPVSFHTEVTFEKVGNSEQSTRVTMRSVFPSPGERDRVVREYNAVEGGKQHLARLGEYLATLETPASPAHAAHRKPFVITRVFKAPGDLVFKVWTERDHLVQWFGPKGTTTPTCTLDLRVGGTFHYCMRMADGQEHWGKWVFREVIAPQGSREGRLVFVASFADAQGNTVRQPWDKNWPMEWLSTVTFAEHAGVGRGTVVTVEWIPINASDLERDTFDAGRGSMEGGWSGTMERLTEHLAKTGTSPAPR